MRDSTSWRRHRLPPAAGAVAAQATVALGSFVLQLLAARSLGAEGLGVFAMLVGSAVIATSVSSGLVGDSLTVLDRHDPAIRAALAGLALAVVLAGATLSFALAWGPGPLSPAGAVLFALAVAAFMTADLLRRTLMACQRYWRLVLVDSSALLVALVLLVALRGRLTLETFVAALLVGQATACAVSLRSLPPAERQVPGVARGGLGPVLAFGSWRALQQFVRPTTLNLVRWLVLLTAGQAAVGELEGARLFTAPAMLLVQGVGAYLFSSYAADRAAPLSTLLRRADRGAALLLGLCCGVALVATAAAPRLGPLLTGGRFELETVAVLGWAVYAASCAVVLPYGSLAAVRGQQAKVLGLRVLDSAAGLAAIAVALLWLGLAPPAAPWLLSVGSVVAGVLCRQRLLVPRAAEPPARALARAAP